MAYSKIFPEDVTIDDVDRRMLEGDITVHPVAAFQILNKILNLKGLCLHIAGLEEDLDGKSKD